MKDLWIKLGHALKRWEAACFFAASWLFYCVSGYRTAAGTRVNSSAFDCILTLDDSVLYRLIVDPSYNAPDRHALHPFYTLALRPLTYLFQAGFSQQSAVFLAQVTIAAAGIAVFDLILRRLPVAPPLRIMTVSLYLMSFSMQLFTIYTETYVLAAAGLSLLYFLFLLRPSLCARPLPAIGMSILAISANIMNYMHYLALVCAYVSKVKPRKGKALALAAVSVALGVGGIAGLSYFLKYSGFNKGSVDQFVQMIPTEYYYISTMHNTHVQSLSDVAAFTLEGLRSGETYAEIFSNLFYAPLVGSPLYIREHLTWSHGCTELNYYTLRWQWFLALAFLGIAGIGFYALLREDTLFERGVVLAFSANVFFYGFMYLRAGGYFYALNFLLLYVLLIAFGAEEIRLWLRKRKWQWIWCGIFAAMVTASGLHSTYQVQRMNAFAQETFKN